ncbi:hypothetical protein VMCG_10012 [Cytospora schulzeri]|uniref:Uncharacterized protein n=1 Tax=Cytospora schulzeri TaxID=448051 RepID=A0A423VI28_9PEZI|nr:hypothetical protein VMCG_10012 [Valsa malicola]
MLQRVTELDPFRWTCSQVLKVEGENDTGNTLRDAREITSFVPESHRSMAEGCLLLDENLRFNSGTNKNITSSSILEVGVNKTLRTIHWQQDAFYKCGGVYEWTKNEAWHWQRGLGR